MTCVLSPTGLIPWLSKTEGNTYTTMLHHPCLFKGKPTHAQEVARRISGAVAGEVASSQDIPSTHHKLLSLSLHYFPFASHFPLPHFTLAILFALFSARLFFTRLFFVRLFLFAFCLLVCWIICRDGFT